MYHANPQDDVLVEKAIGLISIIPSDVSAVPSVYQDQMDVLISLTMMKFRESSTNPAPLLFVKATGCGKYLVRDVHSVMFRGVSLTVFLFLHSDCYSQPFSKKY